MKSYLSLIPLSARVRRKQNKMIVLCIVLAVFLVTAIFSLAEAGMKMETNASIDKAGYWHIAIKGIEEGDAREIAGRDDVVCASWYDVLNLDDNLKMDKDYFIGGAQTALCGIEDSFIGEIMHYFSEGAHVENGNEVILTENAKTLLGVELGDWITLNTPAGSYDFVISGFRITGDGKYVGSNGGVTSALLVKDNQVGAFMNIDTFRRICEENGETGSPRYYIQFGKRIGLRKAIAELKGRYGLSDADVELNTILMASKGISNKSYIQNVYPLAGVLFVMILAAGVMMISGSMNSNVARRTQFFGMLRCIGASRSQIVRIVRLEALNWCKSAVPVGTALGVVVSWIICAGLKYIVGGECENIPVFGVSVPGILSGAVIGIVTVFLAAQAPAKRAARVSPAMAVTGNSGEAGSIRRAAEIRSGRAEVKLGIHHAVSARKNLLLMTGSFALSIVLFMGFSVLLELVDVLIPQKASAPDIDIASESLKNEIPAAFLAKIEGIDGVAHVFGRSVCKDVPVVYREDGSLAEEEIITTVDMISYNDYQLDLLRKDGDLREGSSLEKVYGDSKSVLVIWDKDMPWETGDEIRIAGETVEIAGMLRYNPFTNDGSSGGVINVVASEETFMRLTGVEEFMIVDVQLEDRAKENPDEIAAQIRELSKGYHFRDRRQEGENRSFVYAMMVFVYGFLGMIALIALLNIMNSISMSVSAKIGQYGTMRAIGMSGEQLTRMIAAEAFTYAASGCLTGCLAGLVLSKWMYDVLITAHFYYFTWNVPVWQLVIAVSFVSVSALAAVHAPAKRIREMAVTETIHEL